MDNRAVGIFDSGLGGLTAMKALRELLPEENIIYFGDTGRLPYGAKTREQLRRMAVQDLDLIASHGVKAVIVACGTLSSNAAEILDAYPVPAFGVLKAGVAGMTKIPGTGPLGVIATEASIRSGAFAAALRARRPDAEVFSKPCQSLVALAEHGHFSPDDPVARAAVAEEFAPLKALRPDTLLLACTHFPLFRETIARCMGPDVALLSVGEETARALKRTLEQRDMLARRERGARRWFTSGSTAEFERLGAIFLGHPISAELHIHQENL